MAKNTMIMSMNIQILKTKITSNYNNRSNTVKEKLRFFALQQMMVYAQILQQIQIWWLSKWNQEVGTEVVNWWQHM